MGKNKVYVENNESSSSDESHQLSELTLKSKPTTPAEMTKKTNTLHSAFQDLAHRAYSSMISLSGSKTSKIHSTAEQNFPLVRPEPDERRRSAPLVLENISEEAERRLFSYYVNVVKGGEDYIPSQTLKLTGIPEKTGAFIERRGNACLADILQGRLPQSVDQQRFICLCMSKSNTTHLDLRELNIEQLPGSTTSTRVQKQLNNFLKHLLDYNLNITYITLPEGFQLSSKISERLICNEKLNAAFYYDGLLTKGETPTNITSGEMQAFIHETVNVAVKSTELGSADWTGLKIRQDDHNGQATLKDVRNTYEQTMLTPMKEMLERTMVEPIVQHSESVITPASQY